MRLAYGIHGYGRGHATRALAILSELGRRHDLRVFAGGDAFEALRDTCPVVWVPHLEFVYRGGRRSILRTLRGNLPLLADLVQAGSHTRTVVDAMREFAPQAVLCDCEPFTARAAKMLSIPHVSLDHFGIMARCKVDLPWLDWAKSFLDRTLYMAMFGSARHSLVSSFYQARPRSSRVRVIGTLLRNQARAVAPSSGDHLLAYFNRGSEQFTPGIARVLRRAGHELRLYGTGREGRDDSIRFCPASDRGFLEDLASARAVIGTAGNQLVGEAMHFGKPLMVMPEPSVEQRMNAAAIVRLGIGESTTARKFTAEALGAFLDRTPEYAARARREAHDGREEALATLETWFAEIAAEDRAARVLGEATA
ncbi:MAG: glycosyltransferase family protein [Polyangia bacterium]